LSVQPCLTFANLTGRLLAALVWLVIASACALAQPAGPALEQPGTAAMTPAVPGAAPQPLRVFCAGSLILPAAELEKAFEAANPDVDVQNECHGSIQVIRHVTELHQSIDIVATADAALIPMLMYAQADPDTGRPYADWYVRFASNRLALAYTAHSRFAEEISPENWAEVLARPGVRLGLADPRFDAAGYRALMTLSLAEQIEGKHGLYDRLVKGAFTYPVTRFLDEDRAEISVPEIVEPARGSPIVLRGSSIQLLALLESGNLDYAFEYQSVVEQHALPHISLPGTINLGDPAQQAGYARVQVKLDFQRFASVKPLFRGELIGYGITIPTNAPAPALARRYLAFLFSPAGRAVMQSAHHPLLEAPQCDRPERMPPELRAFCQAGP
jgi:molybdate/tungstate transport system substrate-binding protein